MKEVSAVKQDVDVSPRLFCGSALGIWDTGFVAMVHSVPIQKALDFALQYQHQKAEGNQLVAFADNVVLLVLMSCYLQL